MDDIHVSDWVDISFVMSDGIIFEGSDNVVDTVNASDMGEEGITEASSFRCSLDKAGNIEHFDGCRDFAFWEIFGAEIVESIVWDVDLGKIWIDCAEREILSRD